MGQSPCPDLAVDTASMEYPVTVVGCANRDAFTIRNRGECPATINAIELTDNDDGHFSIVHPSQYPLLLGSGEETLWVTVEFHPQFDDDPNTPQSASVGVSVTSNDPGPELSGAVICGEHAKLAGIRALVTDISSGESTMVDTVKSLTLQSFGVNVPNPVRLSWKNLNLQSTNDVCGETVYYHIQEETLGAFQTTGSNPLSSYRISVQDGQKQLDVDFSLNQCEFVVRELQLGTLADSL